MIKKKKLINKLIGLATATMMVLSFNIVLASAANTTQRSYSFNSSYGSQYHRTQGLKKDNASKVYVNLSASNSGYALVEVWGSDGTSADAANYTTNGDGGSSSVYKILKNNTKLMSNTVYSKYGSSSYVSLRMTSNASGIISGVWSADSE